MNIHLRFFASVRESLNCSDEQIDLPDHVRTVGDVRQFLFERGGVWAETFAPENLLRMAYEQSMCSEQTQITDNSEIAFFPPVTGGCKEII